LYSITHSTNALAVAVIGKQQPEAQATGFIPLAYKSQRLVEVQFEANTLFFMV
jgi:hypothetical protein